MSRVYSHPREYRKILLGNYLCIGFVPGGNLLSFVFVVIVCRKEQGDSKSSLPQEALQKIDLVNLGGVRVQMWWLVSK